MSTFTRWHFIPIAFFLPRLIVGENLTHGAIGHMVYFGAVHPDWLNPFAAAVNYLDGSIRRAACRGQNQDCCA